MKKLSVILMIGAAIWLHPARADAQNDFQSRLQRQTLPTAPGQNPPDKAELTHFNLDFPGGTPAELVKAIEQAEGKPLNAIIPEDYYKVQIPPLKMSGVTVPQMFDALMMASSKSETFVTGTNYGGINGGTAQYQRMQTSYGFKTQGPVTDNSVWYFFHDAPAPPPGEIPPPARLCRFFQMSPFLETYSIDDITTAIETGWKLLDEAQESSSRGGRGLFAAQGRAFGVSGPLGGMSGRGSPGSFPLGRSGPSEAPKLTFHKDTKLLIAVGDPEKLKLIDSVLEQLILGLGKKPADPYAAKPKSVQPSKP